MSNTQEYVVTAKTMDDATSLLDDMETPGGDLYIPHRQVEVTQRREISRNTHFLITEEEANQLRTDPRVLSVELLPSSMGMVPELHWIQTGNFEKSSIIDSQDKNWGLLRVTYGQNFAGWGTNGSFTQTTNKITTTSSGKNVDVVVVDAHINPDHPEFKQNPDGTGVSRVNQYDWFQHSTALGFSTTGSYDYSDMSSNHGTHVAGTMAGNTQGWARDSTIYNMEFIYAGGNGPAGDWALYLFDYIRAFHASKPINTATGKRNPTVTNHSWGYSYGTGITVSSVTSVTYRGVTTAVTGNDAAKKIILEANGVPVPADSYLFRPPARYAALDADIQDAIAEGILVISSAGNSYWNCATPDIADWDNTLTAGFTWNHMQGSSPGAANGVICVGSIGTVTQEYKSNFSNYGKRVDIWGPGSNVVSGVFDSTAASEFGITLVDDPRDSNYKLGSISGTSMSGPQVAGYLACVAEHQPRITQAEALSHLISTAKAQVGTTGGGAGDSTSLGDSSNNRYLFYKLVRPLSGAVSPAVRFKDRPATGAIYPRTRIRRYG